MSRLREVLRTGFHMTPQWMRPGLRAAYERLRQARRAVASPRTVLTAAAPAAPVVPQLELMRQAAERTDAIGIGKRAAGREIVMLVVSDLRVDPRVEREARALAAAGYSVKVYCPDPSGGKVPDLKIDWGPNVNVEFLHWSAASFVMKAPGLEGDQLFAKAILHKPFAFHAHDLNTSLAARAAARVTGAHLVTDFHEWFSENVMWDFNEKKYVPHTPEFKLPMQDAERLCLRDASAVVTVCDSIADAMAAELGNGRRPQVIRNIPNLKAVPTREYHPLKKQFGLADDRFLLLYQGGTGPTRLLEPIIESLGIATRCTLLIRGASLEFFEKDYRAIAARVGAAERLLLSPPVPSRDVVAAARGADAGIWSLPALSRNFTMALPNKIFEYLASGIPVLAADYPEARRVVVGNEVGLTFKPYEPASIAEAINRLIDEPELRANFADNTATALAKMDGDREWQRLVDIYDGLPRAVGGRR